MKPIASVGFIVICLLGVVNAQSSKPWTEWSKKEVEKVLNDSGWSQTQTEVNESQPKSTAAVTQVMSARNEDRNLNSATRVESGESKPIPSVKYHVRFLSAKPVRAAFARRLLLAQTQPNEQLTGQLQGFIDRDFSDYIVVAVSVEVGDEKLVRPVTSAFAAATTEAVQNNVYLERKDGKRLFLMEYRAPTQDGMGAKFVFKRAVDGQPFLADNDNVKFFAQLNDKIKVTTRHKLSEMLYEGKLEY